VKGGREGEGARSLESGILTSSRPCSPVV